jgi:hypothetical protein
MIAAGTGHSLSANRRALHVLRTSSEPIAGSGPVPTQTNAACQPRLTASACEPKESSMFGQTEGRSRLV